MEFRKDINGLRAYAVVAVMLFHFGISGFGGGFVGVDIFFVISGYLMTGIIVTKVEGGRFSVMDFYLARARRIIPALAVLCVVLLLFGWLFLVPSDYQTLGKHVAASISFVSNVAYWREAGYFDSVSHEKWLLHTWSLSVEWQFYILYPIVLALVSKLPRAMSAISWAVIILFSISLLISIYYSPVNSVVSFFSLPTRIWEMMAGGLVYLYLSNKQKPKRSTKLMELSGFLLIAVSIVWFTSDDLWPGYLALLPVLGTVLIMLAARDYSVWTNNRVAQFLGNASYSIYLWHWPIVVLLAYFNIKYDMLWTIVGFVLSVVIGHFSYLYVENPARRFFTSSARYKSLAYVTCVLTAIAVVGSFVFLDEGVPSRVEKSVLIASNEAQNKNPRQGECFIVKGVTSPSCVFGGKDVRLILIGDSHADAIVNAATEALPDQSSGLLFWGYGGCPTMLDVKTTNKKLQDHHCSEFNKNIFSELEKYDTSIPLVIVNRFSLYAIGANINNKNTGPHIQFTDESYLTDGFLPVFRKKMIDSMCSLANKRTVYVVKPIPEIGKNVPKILERALMVNSDAIINIELDERKHEQRNEFVLEMLKETSSRCGIKLLDPAPYLCKSGKCMGSKKGRPLYRDDNHLSEYGNRLLVPMFEKIFQY